jgi:natural product precursor
MKKIKSLKPLSDLSLSREKMRSIMGGDGCSPLGDACFILYGVSNCCFPVGCAYDDARHGYFCDTVDV